MDEVQADLENVIVESESGGGMIKVVMNGKQKLLRINISEEAMKEDKELLEDLIVSAVNKAHSESNDSMQAKMNSVTGGMLGGMKIPGM